MYSLRQLLNSKKFRVMVSGIIAALAAKYFGVSEQTTHEIVGLIMAYIIGQGIADNGKEAAKIAGVFFFAALIPALSSPAKAELYSFEQTCPNGRCPKDGFRPGPASCVSVAYTPQKYTVYLTAGHNVVDRRNNFWIVDKKGNRCKAFLISHFMSEDMAAFVTWEKAPHIDPISFSPPKIGDPVHLEGVLSRRFQESDGVVKKVTGSRITVDRLWSHPGMSGGPLSTKEGLVFGIYHSSEVGGTEGFGTGPTTLRRILHDVENRYGRLQFAEGSVETHGQFYPGCQPCEQFRMRSRSSQTIRYRAEPPPQVIHTPPQPAQRICNCRQDIRELIRDYFTKNPPKPGGRGPRGYTGDPGPPGETPELDYSRLAGLFYAMYYNDLRQKDRRVVLVDGATMELLDDETYKPGDPIVIDIQKIRESLETLEESAE